MQRPAAASGTPGAPGVIDTIAAALSLALERPLLLVVPILLDLYAWVGAKISARALVDAWLRIAPSAADADQQRVLDDVKRFGERANLASLLSLFTPSLLGGVDRGDLADIGRLGEWRPGSWWLAGLLIVALFAAGVVVGVFYLVQLAGAVRGETGSARRLARATLVASLRLVGLAALLLGVGVLILLPVGIVALVLLVLGIGAVPPLTLFVGLPLIWAAIFLAFAVQAVVVSEVGPLRACYLSCNVVRRNFRPTVGLALASLLMSAGLPHVWEKLLGNVPGVILAIVGNAVVGAGLGLASMMFYLDRLRRWQPEAVRPGA